MFQIRQRLENLDIDYGKGKISISVIDNDVKDNADLVLTSFENVIGACLTDSDLKKAYEGSNVKIKVIAQFINKNVPKEDKNLIFYICIGFYRCK